MIGAALIFCGGCGGTVARAAESPAPDSCLVREIERRPLVLEDGQELYLAPRTFESNTKGESLLAGTPNYIFTRGADGRGILVGRDSLLGALIDPRGRVRVIPAPIDPHLVTGIRALARTDGDWSVVFAERASGLHDRPGGMYDQIVALWHGIHDGVQWTSLDSIPFPGTARLSAAGVSISPLTQNTEGDLAWAVGAGIAHGREGVVVFENSGGRWRHEVVNTRSASLGGLLYTPSGDLLLAVIAADTALPPGGSDRNSLFLWSPRNGAWNVTRRVVLGGSEGAVLSASLASLRNDTIITWAAEAGETHALRTQTGAARDVKTVEDDLSQSYRFASVPLADTSHLWVTLHRLSPAPGGETRLRFARLSRIGDIHPVGDMPNPVLDSFRITRDPRGGDILLTGATGVADAGTVVSLVVRYRLVCRGPAH